MDLLAALNVPSLPEQQTRLSHHPDVARALSSEAGRAVRLGFDACCTCARDLSRSTGKESKEEKRGKKKGRTTTTATVFECTRCRRVRYCSDECRRMDADPNLRPMGTGDGGGVDEGDSASAAGGGHGGVVCALLRLCDGDEAVDDRWRSDGDDGTGEKSAGRSSSDAEVEAPAARGAADVSAAEDRVRSEYESYPATLANALLDAPCCRVVLRRASARGGRRTLVVHVVGASYGAELWKSDSCGGGIGLGDVRDAYAGALAEVVDSHRTLGGIDLVFVGPDCPAAATNLGEGWSKPKGGGALTSFRTVKRSSSGNGSGNGRSKDGVSSPSSSCRVTFRLHGCNYEDYSSGGMTTSRGTRGRSAGRDTPSAGSSVAPPPPDVVALFNPGFTCPDYSWGDAVRALTPGAALLVTSNTEMEALLDCRFLCERGRVGGPIPRNCFVSSTQTACPSCTSHH